MRYNDERIKRECELCELSKWTSKPAEGNATVRAEQILLHTDICRFIQPSYMETHVSFFGMNATLHKIHEVKLPKFITEVKHTYWILFWRLEITREWMLQRIQGNNGKELIAKHTRLRDIEIRVTSTSVYSSLSTVSLDRINKTSMEKVRTILKTAKLMAANWSEEKLHSAYVHNPTASEVLWKDTPYEGLLEKTPYKSNLMSFSNK